MRCSNFQQHLALAELPAGHLLADKAYDADSLIKIVRETGAKVCIPPKSNRLNPRLHDKALYKERNQVERMFGRLKEFRRVATRYDKLVRNFMGFVKLAAIYLWLK